MKKNFLKYFFFFITLTFILAGILTLSACIPKALIRRNVSSSAALLCERKQFFNITPGMSSRIDRYADSILLNIAYSYDEKKPLSSVMEAKFYSDEYVNENENLLKAVSLDSTPNKQYIRYWHGSIAYVRPLLLLLDLRQIYILDAIILLMLLVWLAALLISRKGYIPALALFIGLVSTSAWFVPLSLEYTWTFMLMFIISIAAVTAVGHNQYNRLGYLFMAGGMLTSFFDFLTTETITLTVPLLLVLWLCDRDKSMENKPEGKRIIGFIFLWLIGYAGMWMMKWLLASIVLSENVMPYVTEHIQERIGGNDVGYIFGTLIRNVRLLLPFDFGAVGVMCGIALVVLLFYKAFVYRNEKVDWRTVGELAGIGLIPLIRFAVLHNHSYMHCFFTYRALLGTVISVVLMLDIIAGRSFCKKHMQKRKKRF